MTRAKKVRPTIVTDLPERKPHSGLVLGPAAVVPAVLRRISCPWQWDHGARGYLVPRQRLADVEAILTLDGYNVTPRQQVLL